MQDFTFQNIIKQICNEEQIKFNLLSKDWIIMLEKNGKTRFISGYKFGLNSHSVGEILDDKYGLYEVLFSKRVPIIEHKIIYNPSNTNDYAKDCNSYDYVKKYFYENNQHIIIKPNKGTCGNGVYNITNVDEIDNCLNTLFRSNFSLSMCPFYNIKNEYRLIMLNNKCKLIYEKALPIVIGDGKSSIKDLLIRFNKSYFSDKLDNKKYSRILKKNEIFQYDWKFNLSKGGLALKVDNNELKNKLIKIAENVCKSINLKFGSIDIIQTMSNNIDKFDNTAITNINGAKSQKSNNSDNSDSSASTSNISLSILSNADKRSMHHDKKLHQNEDTNEDILNKNISKDNKKIATENLFVIEANSGVMMKNYLLQNKDEYDIVKEIYKQAIEQMFNT